MTASETTTGDHDNSGGESLEHLGIMIPGEARDELKQIAYRRSEPRDRVAVSELVREALAEHYDLDAEVRLDE